MFGSDMMCQFVTYDLYDTATLDTYAVTPISWAAHRAPMWLLRVSKDAVRVRVSLCTDLSDLARRVF